MADLKSCPFCGGEAKLIRGHSYLCVVRCVKYGCSTKELYGDEESTVIALWNTRKPMEAVVAELEAFARENDREPNAGFIDMCIEIVRGKE